MTSKIASYIGLHLVMFAWSTWSVDQGYSVTEGQGRCQKRLGFFYFEGFSINFVHIFKNKF